ncbi:MAG: methyltransferase domain-containing protein [Candidatus Micrarchaeia archaeon]
MKKQTRIVPYLSPNLKKLKRGPAVTLPKDAGTIIAYTGIGKNSKILELGSGSGFLTAQFANIAKEVVSYEKREEFLKVAQSNMKKLGFENVVFKYKDVLEEIDEEENSFDLVFCDIAEAEQIAEKSYLLLKKGGFLSAHCLNIEQAKLLVLECRKFFEEVILLENITREYDVREFGTRPKHLGIMHTAYLVFARK